MRDTHGWWTGPLSALGRAGRWEGGHFEGRLRGAVGGSGSV